MNDFEKLAKTLTEKDLKTIRRIRQITGNGNDVEIRANKDGSYKILEVNRTVIKV